MVIKVLVTLLCPLTATASIAVLGLQAPASAAPAQDDGGLKWVR